LTVGLISGSTDAAGGANSAGGPNSAVGASGTSLPDELPRVTGTVDSVVEILGETEVDEVVVLEGVVTEDVEEDSVKITSDVEDWVEVDSVLDSVALVDGSRVELNSGVSGDVGGDEASLVFDDVASGASVVESFP